MFDELKSFWKNMFKFQGRTRRREFWVSYIWNYAFVYLTLGLPFSVFMSSMDTSTGEISPNIIQIILMVLFGIIAAVYNIAFLIGSVSISVRRCHDIGYSGWAFLLCMLGSLCYIGSIVWFVFCLLDSKEDNKWGPNPKSPALNKYHDSKSIVACIVALILSLILFYIMLLGPVLVKSIIMEMEDSLYFY